jgi:hypothetical protein
VKHRLVVAGNTAHRAQAFIDAVEVSDNQIRIKGSRDVLEKTLLARQRPNPGSQMSPEWRSLGETPKINQTH